jgi:hypothetical protein
MSKSRLIHAALITIASLLAACSLLTPRPRSYSVSLSDVDGDGDADVFATHYDRGYQVWCNDGTGTFGGDAVAWTLSLVE